MLTQTKGGSTTCYSVKTTACRGCEACVIPTHTFMTELVQTSYETTKDHFEADRLWQLLIVDLSK